MTKLIFFLGLLFVFLIPPFQKPDENRHYYQSYALSRFNFSCQKDAQGTIFLPLPTSVYNFPQVLKYSELAHTPPVKFFRSQFGWYPRPTTDPIIQATDWCSWSFIGYLPAAIGLALGHPFGSLLIQFYLARLVTFLVFFAGLLFGLRLTPKPYRSWLFFFSLLPMTLHQAGAISYDSLQLAMVPLIFAYLLNFLAKTPPAPLTRLPLGFILSLLIFVIAKPAFIPFLFLIFLIPYHLKRHLWLTFILCTVLIIPFLRPLVYRDIHPGVNPALQLSVITKDPLYFVGTLTRSFQLDAQNNLEGMVGTLGWLDYGFSYTFYVVAFLVFGYLLARSSRYLVLIPSRVLWLLSLVIFGTVITIYSSLYLTWSLVGDSLIVGVQGRYFLPLIPFLGIWLAQLIARIYHFPKLRQLTLILFSLWLIYQVVASIYLRYYDYSHYGVNEPNFPNSSVPLTQDNYQLAIPGTRAKGIGFAYQLADEFASWIPFRYQLKNADCTRTLRRGYLHFADHLSNTTYQEEVRPFWIENGAYCLVIESLLPVQSPALKFSPLYLTPSLTE